MAKTKNPKSVAPGAQSHRELSRRHFGTVSVAAGLASGIKRVSANEVLTSTEIEVDIATPDGMCDSVLIHPSNGVYPGVIVWTDIRGLRQTFRDFGHRLASEGYTVLIPNPFYRSAHAPAPGPDFNFQNPDDRALAYQMMGELTAPGATERDSIAFIEYLGMQPAVDKSRKIGTTGYCMGGQLTMRTAATMPDRVGAGASFHGGGLVTEDSNSPHLLIPKIKAPYHFGIAIDDDEKQPNAKDKLRAAFSRTDVSADIEVYAGARHGWCVPDNPNYHQTQAERGWRKLISLLDTAIT